MSLRNRPGKSVQPLTGKKFQIGGVGGGDQGSSPSARLPRVNPAALPVCEVFGNRSEWFLCSLLVGIVERVVLSPAQDSFNIYIFLKFFVMEMLKKYIPKIHVLKSFENPHS